MTQLGFSFSVHTVDIDETPYANELASDYLPRMSKTKAETAAEELKKLYPADDLIVLAADTSVISGQNILGKPDNEQKFKQMMSSLSGLWHEVLTSVAVVECRSGSAAHKIEEQTVVTRVKFKFLSETEISTYWQTGEPCDKAGGYGIQGKGAAFVEMIEGSYTNVVGLPLCETANMLSDFGLSVCDIWGARV